MWELDHKEGRESKHGYFITVVLEKTPESPLDCKEIQPVHLKGDQPWLLIGRAHWKGWCWSWNSSILVIWCKQLTHWKSPWFWERLRAEEEGVRGWDGWIASPMQWTWTWPTSGDGEGQRGLGCCSPWGQRVRHEWVTNNSTTMAESE